MPDTITARDDGTGFEIHHEGQFAARCADVVDLGKKVDRYPGKPDRVNPKCALVFVTNSPGKTKDVSIELTVNMGEQAKLRGFLEDWRGKKYTPEQAKNGVPLDKLVGQPALISVEHKRSAKGRTYAVIRTITPLPQGLVGPELNGYQRQPFWVERKKAYAEEVARFQPPVVAKSDPDLPEQLDDEDDDLPF